MGMHADANVTKRLIRSWWMQQSSCLHAMNKYGV